MLQLTIMPVLSDVKLKVKWSRYIPDVAQRVGRDIALLFHDRGTRRGWVVSSTPWLHFTPGKDPVPILQEAGWAPGPVRTGGKSRPHRDSIPDRPARSQSLYRLSYSDHIVRCSCYIFQINRDVNSKWQFLDCATIALSDILFISPYSICIKVPHP